VICQSHFTVSFLLTSPTDGKVVAEQLPSLMPRLFRAADAIGTIHYSRFTVLREKTLLFLGDFDQLMSELATRAGSVFDFIFQHVNSPPPIPVDAHADAFAEWTVKHLLTPVNLYTTYPGPLRRRSKLSHPPQASSPAENTFRSLLTSPRERSERRLAFTRRIRDWAFGIHALIADSRTQAAAN
jgi:hypothetical protein